MLKKIYVTILLLFTLSMFNFAPLGESLPKLLHLVAMGLIIATIILQSIYDTTPGIKKHYTVFVIFFLIAGVISIFPAYYHHKQPFIITIWAHRFMLFYLLYFMLHSIHIDRESLERILLGIAVVYFFFYIIQFAAYPNIIFDTRIDNRRGTISVFLPGIYYVILMYFYSLRKFFLTYNFKYGIFAVMFVIVFILMGNRNILGAVGLISLLYVIFSDKVKYKILMFFLVVIFSIPIFFLFQDIIMNLVKLSDYQANSEFEDPRPKAIRYFLTEFFPNTVSYITGNGESNENSIYGIEVRRLKYVHQFYQSDIGIIGDYTKYGLFYVIAVIGIIVKTIRTKMDEYTVYIKDLMWAIVLVSFTREGAFQVPSSMALMAVVMYMVDLHRHEQKPELNEEEDA